MSASIVGAGALRGVSSALGSLSSGSTRRTAKPGSGIVWTNPARMPCRKRLHPVADANSHPHEPVIPSQNGVGEETPPESFSRRPLQVQVDKTRCQRSGPRQHPPGDELGPAEIANRDAVARRVSHDGRAPELNSARRGPGAHISATLAGRTDARRLGLNGRATC